MGREGEENLLLRKSTADENVKSVATVAASEGRTLLKWHRRLGWLLLFLVIVAISAIALCGKLEFGRKREQITPTPLASKPSATSVPPIYPRTLEKHSNIPKNDVRINLKPFVWGATFGILLSLFLVAVLRRRLDLQLKRKITGDRQEIASIRVRPPEPCLFQSNLVAKTSYDLRRTRWLKQDQMDLEATLRATLRSGGFFTPVSFRRRVMPEYLVLIDRRTYADHSTALTDALLDQLAADGVLLTIHYFDRSPRYCFPKVARIDSVSRSLSIDELADRHADSRLLLFADPLQVLQPGSKRPQNWVKTLTELETPGLFVRQFDELAVRVHDVLRALGFSVFPANQFGLRAYADLVTGQIDESSLRLTRAEVEPPSFKSFDSESAWLGHRQPRHSQVILMVTRLRESLGGTGFLCLCACAIYPEIHWDLTAYLVTELSRREGLGESPEELLSRLAVLPWFRHARMPNWLRVQLIARLKPQQEKLVRQLIEDLLLTALESGPESQFALPIAPTDPALRSTLFRTLIREISRSESSDARVENPLREYVFATFIESRLSVRLPPAIRHLVYSPDLARVWLPLRFLRRFFAGEFGLLTKPQIAIATMVAILLISTFASLTIPKLLPRTEQRLLARALGEVLRALNLSEPATLKGVILANEVGGPPMANISVLAAGANPTTTDLYGRFTLAFPQKQPGDVVNVLVNKEGYVVVNDNQLQLELPANSNAARLTVILAKQADREEMARRFYRLKAYEAIEEAYQKRLKELQDSQQVTSAVLTKLQQERDQAKAAAAEQLAENQPSQVSKLYGEAKRLFLAGKVDDAITLLDIEKLGRLAEKDIKDAVQAWLFKAQLLTVQGRYSEAETAYRAALEASPDDYNANIAYGIFNQKLKRYDKAWATYHRSLELARKSGNTADIAATLNNLGNLDSEQGRLDEARKEFEEALQTYRELAQKNPQFYLPTVSATLKALGAVYRRQGRLSESGKALEEAQNLDNSLAKKQANQVTSGVAPPEAAGSSSPLPTVRANKIQPTPSPTAAPAGIKDAGGINPGPSSNSPASTVGQPLVKPTNQEEEAFLKQSSPDGKRVLTAYRDGTARLWDALTGKAIGEPMKHGDAVESAQFSPDGKRVITTSANGAKRLWDSVRGREIGEPSKIETANKSGGHAGYVMATVTFQSIPAGASVYLIPAYIWDLGSKNQPPPSKLKESELKDYLKEHFEFLRGKTDFESAVIEQNYVALFLLGEKMRRLWLDIRIGRNSASVSFEDR